MQEQFYRHTGVYGICVANERMLVIRKSLGPYTGQYDLPGGRLEQWESLEEGLRREVREETGHTVAETKPIGVADFAVRWHPQHDSTELLHHIAMLYEVVLDDGEAGAGPVGQFVGQDSSGCEWIAIDEVSAIQCSPLVQCAAEWYRTGTIPASRSSYDYRIARG